jgi:uncharacterized protein (DUF433 family)
VPEVLVAYISSVIPPTLLTSDMDVDVETTLPLISGVPYDKRAQVTDEVSVVFHDAGHILGSAMLELTARENGQSRRVLFSGDVGQWGKPAQLRASNRRGRLSLRRATIVTRALMEGHPMTEQVEYKHLKSKPGSNYRQLFVNGRIRAEILYRETVGSEPLTPEEVAKEYGLPVEAVMEAIDYCTRNQDLLDAERAREAARIKAAGRDRWPYAPRGFEPQG